MYVDFGTSIQANEQNTTDDNQDGYVKEFGIGEHIISTPILFDNRTQQMQYDFYDGYEIIGIVTTGYGNRDNAFGGGAVLYRNTQTVKCIRDSDGDYTTFGIPFSYDNAEVKTLS